MNRGAHAILRALAALAFVAACSTPVPQPQAAPRKAPEKYRSVEGAAGKLRVSDGGAGGLPIVFVHDLGSDLEAWRAQLDHLRRQRRAIAYDQRGHGKSDRARDGVYTIAALADDLERVARALGVDRFYLVGHGLAGAVLTTYAAAHPEKVAGLVYAEAVGDLRAVPRQRIDAMLLRYQSPSFGKPQLRDEFSLMLNTGARPDTKKRVIAALDRLDPPAYAALRRSLAEFSAADLLPRYSGPRIAIEAEGGSSPALFSALDKAVSRVAIKGVSHWIMMDDPDAFERPLDAFVGLESR